MLRSSWIIVCAVLVIALWTSARASAPPQTSPGAPYRDFEQVCMSIFAQKAAHTSMLGPDGKPSGDKDEANAAGAQICQCTSKESKHQGVTVPELKKETAEIRKDPKYQIKNPKLLASFQYCVVLAMDQKSDEMDEQGASDPSDAK